MACDFASISSTFGYRWGKLHKGIDITGNKNIMAADNGKVTKLAINPITAIILLLII